VKNFVILKEGLLPNGENGIPKERKLRILMLYYFSNVYSCLAFLSGTNGMSPLINLIMEGLLNNILTARSYIDFHYQNQSDNGGHRKMT
jgi:hypothetical protein